MRRISVGLLKNPIKQLIAEDGNYFAAARAEEEGLLARNAA
jgi:hypothetical protein